MLTCQLSLQNQCRSALFDFLRTPHPCFHEGHLLRYCIRLWFRRGANHEIFNLLHDLGLLAAIQVEGDLAMTVSLTHFQKAVSDFLQILLLMLL